MLHSCLFSYRCARILNALTLVTFTMLLPGAMFAHPQTLPVPARLEQSAEQFSLFVPIASRPRTPLGIIVQPAELQPARAQYEQRIEPGRSALNSLFTNANEALATTPCAVAAYTTSTGYDCLNQSSEDAYLLALAYRLTGNPTYSQKGAEFIRVWSRTLTGISAAEDQPNLDWSRLVPAMIWGADLLTGAPGWGEDDRLALIAMLRTHALPQAKAAATRKNNWADAGNVLWLSIAVYANLPAERAAAVRSWKLKLDGEHPIGNAATQDACADTDWVYGMCRDGSLTEENRRGLDGLSYNQGALSMKTVFAEIMRRQGDGSLYSYTTPRGVGLKNGWDFLAPKTIDAFAKQCTWPYSTNHCVNTANRSGWEIAYAYWHAPAYLPVLAEHRPYGWSNWADPGYSTAVFSSRNLSGN